LFFFDYLVLVVGVLFGVAFFTLMERKVLGYMHFRKGPTKVFYFGEFQPIGDAAKLFTKELFKVYFFFEWSFDWFASYGFTLVSLFGCIFCVWEVFFFNLCFFSFKVRGLFLALFFLGVE
jgi:NADH:ubiquinone oxidoreductase subunit H